LPAYFTVVSSFFPADFFVDKIRFCFEEKLLININF
jgi:hypothetical protein